MKIIYVTLALMLVACSSAEDESRGEAPTVETNEAHPETKADLCMRACMRSMKAHPVGGPSDDAAFCFTSCY